MVDYNVFLDPNVSRFHLSDSAASGSAKRWKRWSMTVLIRTAKDGCRFTSCSSFLSDFSVLVYSYLWDPFEVSSHAVNQSDWESPGQVLFRMGGYRIWASFERQECHLGSRLKVFPCVDELVAWQQKGFTGMLAMAAGSLCPRSNMSELFLLSIIFRKDDWRKNWSDFLSPGQGRESHSK